MERGMDPELKKYFRKVMYSFFFGLMWLAVNVTAGIYFELAYSNELPLVFIILFYAFLLISLIALLRYYYNTWKK